MTQILKTRTTPIQFIPIDQVGTRRELTVDVEALEAGLRQNVRGEVRFDKGSRGMYAHDGGNYRMAAVLEGDKGGWEERKQHSQG